MLCFSTRAVRFAPSALYLDFYSIGAGIDDDILEYTENAVFQQLSEGVIDFYETTRWGREGEITLCMEYNNVNSSRELLSKIVPEMYSLTRNPMVNVYLGDSCGDKAKATLQDISSYK